MHVREFEAVYRSGLRVSSGPLTFTAIKNPLGHPRLGLSVPKRVGHAAARNRIKRLLRESFRRMQQDFPGGYDLVINVRPHEPYMLSEYQRAVFQAVRSLHGKWFRMIEEDTATDRSRESRSSHGPSSGRSGSTR